MRDKRKLSKLIHNWGIVFILAFSGVIIVAGSYFGLRNTRIRYNEISTIVINQQKELLKSQVESVVSTINYEKNTIEKSANEQVKKEVNKGYLITENLYNKYKSKKSKSEVIQLIMEALRPIRFNNGNGYLFSNDLDGNVLLFPTIPAYEKSNIQNLQDSKGKYVVLEQNKICKEKGEGFVIGYWPKPGFDNKIGFKKISFIKYFEPYNFYIGAGVYLDEVDEKIRNNLLETISNIRYGSDGYIFINRLNGDALVSNGKKLSGKKKLWEEFDENPQKVEALFKKEFNAAMKPNGDFINYTWHKLTNSNKEISKISFIYGIPEFNWLIGAGVYLDEIEIELRKLKAETKRTILIQMFFVLLVTLIVIVAFLLLLKKMNKKINKDYQQFHAFFHKASSSNELIDISKIRYKEFESLAENANKMLQEKIADKQDILKAKEHLLVTIRSIGDAVITTDEKGNVDFLNNIAERLTGWRNQEAKGKNLPEIFNIIKSENREIAENPVQKVFESKKIVELANHTILISKNKTEYQIADSAAPIKDNEGKILGVVLVFRNVTKEYKMQRNLIESEKEYKSILENMIDGYYRSDKDGNAILLSPSVEKILGFNLKEMIGKKISLFYANPQEREKFLEKIKKYGSVENYPAEFKKKNSKNIFIETNSKIYYDENGEYAGVEGTFRDVTEENKLKKKLVENERNYRLITESSPDFISKLDLEGNFIYSNSARNSFGFTKDDLIGKSIYDFISPIEAEKLKQQQIHLIKNPEDIKKPIFLNFKDKEGKWHFLQCNGNFILDENGLPEAFLIISRDITEQKKSQQEIRKLSKVAESTNQSVVISKLSGKIVYVNQTLLKLLGWANEKEVLKKSLLLFCDKESKIKINEIINPILLSKGSYKGELTFIRKNKTTFPGELFSSVILDDSGKPEYFLTLFSDITERKLHEQKLRDNLNQFEIINANTPSIVWKFDIDNDGRFINSYISNVVNELLLLPKGTIDNNFDKPFQYIKKEYYEKIIQTIENAVANPHKIVEIDFEVIKGDGKTAWFRTKARVRIENNLTTIFGSTIDITQQRINDRELQKVENLKSIGTLAGGIAHDFNNILTGIYGNVSLAEIKMGKDHPSYKYLLETEKSINRATKLTKQLLTFSRGGAPIKKDINLQKLIMETVCFDLTGSNVKPIFNFADNLKSVKVDEGQIQQVFSNLTINANQASPEGGHLFVTLENSYINENEITGLKSGDYLKIIVQDEGTGIEQKHLDKIFDPYFTTKKTGNGLGLATTYSIIQKHNGHLKIESEIGKGTTFTIYLPASKIQTNIEGKSITNIVYSNKKPARILVMDDEEIILSLSTKMLEVLGYQTDTAVDGLEAIKKYKESLETGYPFDIIIMDLTIPGSMGGKKAVQQVLKINPEAKVIVSSGYFSDNSMDDYQEFGFKQMIEKPFTIARLKEIIQKVLNN